MLNRKRAHDLRDMKVLQLASKGYTSHTIATRENLTVSMVQRILGGWNELAKQELRTVLYSEIPLSFKKSILLLDHLNSKTLEILDKATDQRVQLQAIATSKDLLESRNALLVDASILSQAIDRNQPVLLKPQEVRAN